MSATTKVTTSAPKPATPGSPTFLSLAEDFVEATRDHDEATVAARLAHEARRAAKRELDVAAAAAQEGARAILHAAEAEHREADRHASTASHRKDAASVALARAMHDRKVKFARLGDHLLVDASVYHPPIDRMSACVTWYGSLERITDYYVPPPNYSAEIVFDLPDAASL